MRLSERSLLLPFTLCCITLCNSKVNKEKKGRHLLSLLGYLHGYKIGQDYALQLQPYFISPVIIIPTVNQQQSVTIQEPNNDENYQESGSTIQTITSGKLISNVTDLNAKTETTEKIEQFSMEDTKENDKNSSNITSVAESFRQATSEKVTITATTNTELPTTITTKVEETTVKTTKPNGPYTSAPYNNQKIDSIQLTTLSYEENPELPPVSDNRWQNFTLKANLSNIFDENRTLINEQRNNTAVPETVTEHPVSTKITYSYGRYPNSLYNNAMIDQLSITTNSYTNEESPLLPSENDRWSRFPSYNKFTYPKSEGFKPLAGLYYDGFLHRPLKKFGFIPDNYVY